MLKKSASYILLISLSTFAAEDGASVYLEGLKKDNPKLSAALSIQGVNQIYTKCFNGISTSNAGVVSGQSLMNCVWKGDPAYGVQAGVDADDDLKNKVIEAMNDNKKYRSVASQSGSVQPISDSAIATNRYEDKAKLPGKEKSKSLIALEEHLKSQLQEALYGKVTNNKNNLIQTERIVDQKTFFELFESQVGKNVISSLSNFCLNAQDLGEFFVIYYDEKKREDVAENNMKNLDNLDNENKLVAAKNWNSCIARVQDHCHQPEKKIIKDTKSGKFDEILVDFKSNFENKCKLDKKDEICNEADITYTQQRACETVEYISQARRSLEYNKQVMEKFDDLKTQGSVANVDVYSSKGAKKNIDEITTLTSNDLNEKPMNNGALSAIEAGSEEANAFKECFENGTIKDATKCEGYLNKNTDERLAALTEMKINSEASIKELEELVKDEEKVVQILIQDGYDKDEAALMAKESTIKDQILDRYKKKENAILRSAVEEMEKITSTKNDTIDDLDKNKLEKIEKELKNKTKDFAQLVHFNNIVVGYLDINSKDENGKDVKKKNSRSIQLELAGNLFNEQNREVASKINDSFTSARKTDQNFEEKLKQSGYSEEDVTEDADDVQLSPKDIVNELIGIFKSTQN